MSKRVTKAELQKDVDMLRSAYSTMCDRCTTLEIDLGKEKRKRFDAKETSRNVVLCFLGRTRIEGDLWNKMNTAMKLGERNMLLESIVRSDEFVEWMLENYRGIP